MYVLEEQMCVLEEYSLTVSNIMHVPREVLLLSLICYSLFVGRVHTYISVAQSSLIFHTHTHIHTTLTHRPTHTNPTHATIIHTHPPPHLHSTYTHITHTHPHTRAHTHTTSTHTHPTHEIFYIYIPYINTERLSLFRFPSTFAPATTHANVFFVFLPGGISKECRHIVSANCDFEGETLPILYQVYGPFGEHLGDRKNS